MSTCLRAYCASRGDLTARPPRCTFGVGVDHGGFDIPSTRLRAGLVAEQFLDGADTCPEPQALGVAAVLEEVGGETVAEGVGGDGFVYFGEFGGTANGFLQDGFIYVV